MADIGCKDILRAYGPLNRDSRAMVQKLGRAVNSSIDAAYSQIATNKRALAKNLRWESVVGNANTEVAGKDYQRGYDIICIVVCTALVLRMVRLPSKSMIWR